MKTPVDVPLKQREQNEAFKASEAVCSVLTSGCAYSESPYAERQVEINPSMFECASGSATEAPGGTRHCPHP